MQMSKYENVHQNHSLVSERIETQQERQQQPTA